MKNPRPLYVDLDQSLLLTDVLWELVAQLVCRKPWKIPILARACVGDRARLKTWLNAEIDFPVELLPWNTAVLELIQIHKAASGRVFLATATHEQIARRIADFHVFFDGVLATVDGCNLKGEAKLAAIRTHCKTLGAEGFDYIGDSRADIPIWQAAEEAWLVPRHGRWLEKMARQSVSHLKTLQDTGPGLMHSWLRLMRPRQWSKNILLFLPLILAHRIHDAYLVGLATLAFTAFSLAASAVYAFNDCADVFRDRAHSRKRKRPLASGDVPLWHAPLVSFILLVAAGLLSWLGVGNAFIEVLGVYLAANLLYTFWLKHRPVMDVVCLALLYTLRIFAGGVATGLEVSKWLLTFSLFFFLSLAFGKRYQEIAPEAVKEQPSQRVRGYLVGDLPIIGMGGLSAGFISVMVLALYVQSPEVLKLYSSPVFLWLLCPLVIYWISRFWLLTGRGCLHDDPVVFALNDRASLAVGLLMLGVIAAAQLFPALVH
ncbi:MAG: UbiA family prenyltransferase [Verrucomicrobiota bacterium]